jgi:hypothetical protein
MAWLINCLPVVVDLAPERVAGPSAVAGVARSRRERRPSWNQTGPSRSLPFSDDSGGSDGRDDRDRSAQGVAHRAGDRQRERAPAGQTAGRPGANQVKRWLAWRRRSQSAPSSPLLSGQRSTRVGSHQPQVESVSSRQRPRRASTVGYTDVRRPGCSGRGSPPPYDWPWSPHLRAQHFVRGVGVSRRARSAKSQLSVRRGAVLTLEFQRPACQELVVEPPNPSSASPPSRSLHSDRGDRAAPARGSCLRTTW